MTLDARCRARSCFRPSDGAYASPYGSGIPAQSRAACFRVRRATTCSATGMPSETARDGKRGQARQISGGISEFMPTLLPAAGAPECSDAPSGAMMYRAGAIRTSTSQTARGTSASDRLESAWLSDSPSRESPARLQALSLLHVRQLIYLAAGDQLFEDRSPFGRNDRGCQRGVREIGQLCFHRTPADGCAITFIAASNAGRAAASARSAIGGREAHLQVVELAGVLRV